MTDPTRRNGSPAAVEKAASRARTRSKFRAQRAEAKRGKDHRILHCFRLMTSNQWVPGRSERDLAEHWKQSLRTVEAAAREAKRLVRFTYDATDQQDRVAQFVTGIAEQMRACVQARNYRDFTRLAQLYADVTGLNAPTKVEVSGSLSDLLTLGLEGDQGVEGTDPEVEGES